MKKGKNIVLGLLFLMVVSCGQRVELPILGETSVDPYTGDLVHYKAPDFQMKNQLNSVSHRDAYNGKVHVVDFFFTSCPTICPQMTNHLKRVEEAYAKEDRVSILSYSIDPVTDTPERLKAYAEEYDIDDSKWALLTGGKEEVLELAKGYKVRAFDDSLGEERNLIHDGTFVLIDGRHRIRGYYNGLDEKDTQRLITDIARLLKE
jgi:protein SCO1/2